MQKVLAEIKKDDFLNQFSFRAMDCFIKPFLILREIKRPGCSLYYLLFKELNSQVIKEMYRLDLLEFIMKKAGLSNSREYATGEAFSRTCRELIHNGTYVLLLVNLNYASDVDRTTFKSRNHVHFTILKGYDTGTQNYLVVDEDLFRKHLVNTTGAVYIEQEIPEQELMNRCLGLRDIKYNLEECSTQTGMKQDFFGYMVVGSRQEKIEPFTPEDLIRDYRELITLLIDNAEAYDAAIIGEFTHYREKREQTLEAFNTARMRFLRNTGLGVNLLALETQMNYFRLVLADNDRKQELLADFQSILNQLEITSSYFSKWLAAGKEKTMDKILDRIKEVTPGKVKLYQRILDTVNIDSIPSFRKPQ